MKNEKNLYNLDELSDYKVASDDPNVKGWEVRDADNRIVGKIDNLLVNKERKRVVYLDVDVDKSIIDANHDPYGRPANSDVREFVNKDGETHVIIPIGMVHLNEETKVVHASNIDYRTFSQTKRYRKGQDLDRDYEVIVLESYNRDRDLASENEHKDSAAHSNDNDRFYDRPEFDDRHYRR